MKTFNTRACFEIFTANGLQKICSADIFKDISLWLGIIDISFLMCFPENFLMLIRDDIFQSCFWRAIYSITEQNWYAGYVAVKAALVINTCEHKYVAIMHRKHILDVWLFSLCRTWASIIQIQAPIWLQLYSTVVQISPASLILFLWLKHTVVNNPNSLLGKAHGLFF